MQAVVLVEREGVGSTNEQSLSRQVLELITLDADDLAALVTNEISGTVLFAA